MLKLDTVQTHLASINFTIWWLTVVQVSTLNTCYINIVWSTHFWYRAWKQSQLVVRGHPKLAWAWSICLRGKFIGQRGGACMIGSSKALSKFWIWNLGSEEERAQSFQTNCEVDHGAIRCRIGCNKSGTKIRMVAHDFGILCSTLKIIWLTPSHDKKRGMPSVLTLKEERELVEYVKKMANLGYPSTFFQLWLKVVEMI